MSTHSRPTPWHWVIALLAMGIALSFVLLAGYVPMVYPDTGTCQQAARELLSGDCAVGQARRTPGDPLLVALVGESPPAVVPAQTAMGPLISWLPFAVTLQLTGRAGLAFAVGLSHHLNLQQLFQGATLLTETLSALSMVAVAALSLAAVKRIRDGRASVAQLVLLGVPAAYALRVRPQFVFLVLLLPALVVYALSGLCWPRGRTLALGAAVGAPAIAIVLA